MNPITGYTIIIQNSVVELEASVKDAIKKGWTPLGGPGVSPDDTSRGNQYFQAMVAYGH